MPQSTDFHIGDVVHMRKRHPCGGDSWRIERLGSDIGIRCLTCGRRALMARARFARQVKSVDSDISEYPKM